jgi:hypothetical protein
MCPFLAGPRHPSSQRLKLDGCQQQLLLDGDHHVTGQVEATGAQVGLQVVRQGQGNAEGLQGTGAGRGRCCCCCCRYSIWQRCSLAAWYGHSTCSGLCLQDGMQLLACVQHNGQVLHQR